MTYTTKTWNNFAAGGTPLNATGLNDLESRIAAGIAAAGGGGGTGTTYYVANNGSDAAAGTSLTTPWQTVSKVNSMSFNAGDVIRFKRNDIWRTTLLQVPSSGITFDAYGGGNQPVLSGGVLITGWSSTGGGTYSASATLPTGLPALVTYTVNRATTILSLGSGSGSLVANQYFAAGGTIWVNLGDTVAPSGDIEIPTRLVMDCFSRDTISIKNITFSHGNDSAVILGDSTVANHLVDTCTFQYTTMTSGGRAGALDIRATGPEGVRVTNSTFQHLANDGIYISNTKNVEIDHCTIIDVGSIVSDQQSDGIQIEATAASSNSDGAWIHDNYVSMGTQTIKGCIIVNSAPSVGASANAIVERNTCIGGKFGVAAHANNVVVRNNVIHGQTSTDAQAIWIDPTETYTGMVLTYNLIYGCYFGINAGTSALSRQVVVAHNTIVDCTRAPVVFDCPIYGNIKNNILWNTGSLPTLRCLYIGSITGGQTLLLDNNIYTGAFANYLFLGGFVTASTLAAWKAGNGGRDVNTISSDPLFTSASTNVYTLTAASPAINTGAVVPGIGEVILGSAPDIGYSETA